MSTAKCFLGYSQNENVRRYSSSGGFTKEIMSYALLSGRVSKLVYLKMVGIHAEVVVTDDPMSIFTPNANSIYQPLSPLSGISQLANDEKCGITLLPCHVELAPKDRCGLIIELICKRVPTFDWTLEILAANGVKSSEIKEFQYREGIWPGKGRIELNDGSVGHFDFRHAWDTGVADTQPKKCLSCKRFGLTSDIMVGDPWRIMPLFRPNESGKTLVIVNNPELVPWIRGANVVLEVIDDKAVSRCLDPHLISKGRKWIQS